MILFLLQQANATYFDFAGLLKRTMKKLILDSLSNKILQSIKSEIYIDQRMTFRQARIGGRLAMLRNSLGFKVKKGE
jgi:hypothetical protein